MKAYRIEVLVIDFEEIGGEVIAELMERVRYPNDCVSPLVMSQQEADIGTWSDDHALNHGSSSHGVENFRQGRVHSRPFAGGQENRRDREVFIHNFRIRA